MQSMSKSSMVKYKSLKLGLDFKSGTGLLQQRLKSNRILTASFDIKKMKWVTDTETGGSDLMIVEVKLGQYSNPTYY